jgi:hypothetical protein
MQNHHRGIKATYKYLFLSKIILPQPFASLAGARNQASISFHQLKYLAIKIVQTWGHNQW